jgi:iron complex outermembrane receptor protein
MSKQIDRFVRLNRFLGVSALFLWPVLGLAQEAPPEKPVEAASTEPVETVVVSGIRASYQRAIEAKRNADAIVDAISAEDVGKFPDQNVAESLSHLPGLAVDRQFGEGEKVSILGTDPALNRVLINGQTVATGDWGGNPNDPTSRTFNYLLLSPELIGLAEVYKSPEARIDEGSIGGTVIIHTRKPLDLKSNTLAASGGYEYNDRSEKGNPRGSVLYSWKNDEETFGVLAAYTHDKADLARAGLEIFGYSSAASFPAEKVTGGDPATAIYPAGINAAYFSQERKRDGFTTTLQARPTEPLKLDLTGIYIDGKYDNVNNALFIFPAASTDQLVSATISNGLVTSATYGPGAYTERDTGLRKTTVTTQSVNFTTEWDAGGPLSWQGVVGTTKATGGEDPEYLMDLRSSSAYSYTYNATSASVTWAQSPLDPTTVGRDVGQQIGGIGYYKTLDKENYAQADVTWKVDAGPFTKLLAGVKYTDHENNKNVYTSKVFVQDSRTLESQLNPGLTPDNLFDGIGAEGDLSRWATVGIDALVNYDETTPNGDTFAEARGEEFDIKEKTAALYTQGNFEGQLAGKNYRGNVGVRFVHTSDDSFGYLEDSETHVLTPSDTVTKYTKPLPNVNFAWEAAPDVLLRLGVGKVIARPRFKELAQYISFDNRGLTASGGNPNLKPYLSTNYGGTAEWYFARGSLASVELFYRDISDYVVSKVHDEMLLNPLSGQVVSYFVTTPINAEKASVKGAALQFEMPLVGGFGIATNYTYATAQTTNDYNMPYLSKNTWNLIPYYERGPFSGRVSYGYRSKYFTAIGRLAASQFTDEYKELDASASWDFTSHLRFTVTAVNLLDELYDSFNGVQDAPIGLYKSGRIFTAGVAYKL